MDGSRLACFLWVEWVEWGRALGKDGGGGGSKRGLEKKNKKSILRRDVGAMDAWVSAAYVYWNWHWRKIKSQNS